MDLDYSEKLIILNILDDIIEDKTHEINGIIYHMEDEIKVFGEKIVKEDIDRLKAKIKELEDIKRKIGQ